MSEDVHTDLLTDELRTFTNGELHEERQRAVEEMEAHGKAVGSLRSYIHQIDALIMEKTMEYVRGEAARRAQVGETQPVTPRMAEEVVDPAMMREAAHVLDRADGERADAVILPYEINEGQVIGDIQLEAAHGPYYPLGDSQQHVEMGTADVDALAAANGLAEGILLEQHGPYSDAGDSANVIDDTGEAWAEKINSNNTTTWEGAR